MNYGITGTRRGMTKAQEAVFIRLIADRTEPGFIYHGDCVGVDANAHWLAFELGTSAVIFPPTDDKLRAYCDGWSLMRPAMPYLVRNREIVRQCDHLLAFPAEYAEQSKGGTWFTVRYARTVGKPLTIVWPDGTTATEPPPTPDMDNARNTRGRTT